MYYPIISDLKNINNSTYRITVTADENWLGYNQFTDGNYSGYPSGTPCSYSNITCNNLDGSNNYDCPVGCNKCNMTQCTDCSVDYVFDVNNLFCVSKAGVNMYYLETSSISSTLIFEDFKLADSEVTTFNKTAISVSFVIKMYNTTYSALNNTVTILQFGSDISLTYNTVTKTLSLIYVNAAIPTQAVLASYNNFNVYAVDSPASKPQWARISFSYMTSDAAYYPPMMNFQVNSVDCPILQPSSVYNNLNAFQISLFNNSHFSFGKLFILQKYANGFSGELYNRNGLFQSGITKYIDGSILNTQCVNTTKLIEKNVTFKCSLGYSIPLTEEASWCKSTDGVSGYGYVNLENTFGCIQSTCTYGGYALSSETTPKQLCSCTSTNTIYDNILVNNGGANNDQINYNDCQKPTQLDFAQLANFKQTVQSASTEFTLEFWIYIKAYVTNDFTSISFNWENHVEIQISNVSNKLQSVCIPTYRNLSDNNIITVTQSFTTNWVYLRCAVDLIANNYHHWTNSSKTQEYALNSTGVGMTGNNFQNPTNLIYTNNFVNRGVIFIRQLRLWSTYLGQPPDVYYVNIQNSASNYPKLLNLYDPTLSSPLVYNYTISDIKNQRDLTVTLHQDFAGSNIWDNTGFSAWTPCTSNEYNPTCFGQIKMNQIQDISRTVSPSLTQRYTIELWAMVSDITQLTMGFHVQWQNLVSVSITNNISNSAQLQYFCWPQDYYKINLNNTMANTYLANLATGQNINSVSNVDTTTANNSWFHIRCAVDLDTKLFYLNSGSEQTLNTTPMLNGQNSQSIFKYFWHQTPDDSQQTSLNILGANTNSNNNVYIRNVYLFDDYIPVTYQFPNHDLTKLNQGDFQSLLYSVSFFNYYREINVYLETSRESHYKTVTANVLLTVNQFTFDNTVVPPLSCDPTAQLKYGVNPDATKYCKPITLESPLNASFYKSATEALVCSIGNLWDGSQETPSSRCKSSCSNNMMRSPHYWKNTNICNFPCQTDSNKCPTTFDQMYDMNDNYECNDSSFKFGNFCYDNDVAQNSYAYFNGCYNFPNISYNLPSSDDYQGGYTINFDIKLDSKNEFCNYPGKTNYYFALEPHFIYLKDNQIHYSSISDTAVYGTLDNFNMNSWNTVSIQVNNSGTSKQINVFLNNNFFTPSLTFNTEFDLTVKALTFCPNKYNGDSSTCSGFAPNFAWGAAFYKNIHIWTSLNTNPWVIQNFKNGVIDLNQNIFYQEVYFPMSMNSVNFDYLMNLAVNTNNGSGLAYSNMMSDTGDLAILFNFDSVTDISDISPGSYTYSDFNENLNVDSCALNCSRCTSSSSNSCVECSSGYVLYSNTCQLITGNYAKFPFDNDKINNLGLHLRTSNSAGNFTLSTQNVFSFTIWIKYLGQSTNDYLNQSPYDYLNGCVLIFNFSSDNRFNICYNPTTYSLYFYDYNEIMFVDNTVFNSLIGQWTLIAFSNVAPFKTGVPDLNNYYKPIYRFYVQNQEIAVNSQYAYTSNIIFDRFDIVYQFNGLLSDLNVYNDFLVNPYGYILSSATNTKLVYTVTFNQNENNNTFCLIDTDFDPNQYLSYIPGGRSNLYQTIGGSSKPDYQPYTSQSCPNQNYFDVTIPFVSDSTSTCASCDKSCPYACSYNNLSNTNSFGCSCETESTEFWLKQNSTTSNVYCESVSYTDFSRGAVTATNIAVSPTQEFTTEFWVYVNYYGTDSSNNAFQSHDVIWDLHNYVHIYQNENNGISVICSPVYNSTEGNYYDGTKDSSLVFNDDYSISPPTDPNASQGNFKTWVYVQCSASIPIRLYYVNNRPVQSIIYDNSTIPNITNVNTTTLSIVPNGPINYGFLFIRQLKLWTQYNIRMFTTECVQTKNSLKYYQFLNHIFDNKVNGYQIIDFVNPLVNSTIIRDPTFMGFNVIGETPISYDPPIKCSQLLVFPTTAYAYDIFNFQAQEQHQNPKNSYTFFYVIKDLFEQTVMNKNETTNELISNREWNYLFSDITQEYFGKQIGSDNNTLLVDVYCNITYAVGVSVPQQKITLYQQLTLRQVTGLQIESNFGNITTTLNIYSNTTDFEVFQKANSLANLESDMYKAITVSFIPLASTNDMTLTGAFNSVVYANPTCSGNPNYCNTRGVCYAVDINLYCQCNTGYVGINCQMTQANHDTWVSAQNVIVSHLSSRIANGVVDSNILKGIASLFNATANLATSLNQTTEFQAIMTKISDNANLPENAKTFESNIESLMTFAYQMLQLRSKSANNDRYSNLLALIKSNQTVAGATINYYNTTDNTQISGRLLTGVLNPTLISIPGIAWTITLDDAAVVPLTLAQQAYFQAINDQVTAYLYNIANGIFSSNPTTEVEHIFNSDAFNFAMKKIFNRNINTFDFIKFFTVDLGRLAKRNSYFDAKQCLIDFTSNSVNKAIYDFSSIGLVYIEKKIPDHHYNLNLMAGLVSTTHTITFFDNNGKQIILNNCSSGVTHYLPINIINNDFGFVKDIAFGNLKYTALIVELSKNYVGNLFPYFIFPNGTIDHNITGITQQWYYKNYNVSLQYYDNTLGDYAETGVEFNYVDDNLYIVGNSLHLSEFTSFAVYAPVNIPAKNWYFMDFNNLHTCMSNIKGNMCFYVVIILFGLHIIYLLIAILIAAIKKCRKNSVENFKADLQDQITMSLYDNDKFGDIRVFSVDSPKAKSNAPVNIEFQIIENKADNPTVLNAENEAVAEIKDVVVQFNVNKGKTENVLVSNVVQTQGGLHNASNSKFYNFFYFILFRNIYVNTFATSSPFAPKYKSVSKLAFFLYLLFLIVLLCVVYFEQDLVAYKMKNQGELVGLLFIAVFCANAVLIVFGLIIRTSNADRNAVISAHVAKRDLTNLVAKTARQNYVKTIVLNILSIGLAGVLYYFAVGFCATWINWAHNLLILWLLVVLTDFLVAEICFELLIYVFYICRNSCSFFGLMFRFVLSLKNLRNYA